MTDVREKLLFVFLWLIFKLISVLWYKNSNPKLLNILFLIRTMDVDLPNILKRCLSAPIINNLATPTTQEVPATTNPNSQEIMSTAQSSNSRYIYFFLQKLIKLNKIR